MEKTLKELIAEMDRIESSAKLDEGIIENLRNTVRTAMDQIAYQLGYEPRQPDLRELHSEVDRLNAEMDRLLEEMDRVSEQIRNHPEHQQQSRNTGRNTTADPESGSGTSQATPQTSPVPKPDTSGGQKPEDL